MKYIGAHVSVSGGVANAPLNANEIGAKAFALFTGNASRWASKDISEKEAALFNERCAEFGYTPDIILPHDNFSSISALPTRRNSRSPAGRSSTRCAAAPSLA